MILSNATNLFIFITKLLNLIESAKVRIKFNRRIKNMLYFLLLLKYELKKGIRLQFVF